MREDGQKLSVVLLYKRNAEPDGYVLQLLEDALSEKYDVFIDRNMLVGVEWAQEIEKRIRSADAVAVILSDVVTSSEMLEYELETATNERNQRGLPKILPIRLQSDQPVQGAIGAYVNDLNYIVWKGQNDNERIVADILAALEARPTEPVRELQLEPAGGAVQPGSPFYVVRKSDAELFDAINAHESVILVRGPRQIGKTSLVGQGTKMVTDAGWRHVTTDFQMASSAQLKDAESFSRMLAATLVRQVGFYYDFKGEWLDVFGPNMNLANFMRALIAESELPLVWFMDEADRLFSTPFASDFFGLVRSWHNARATDPNGPWGRFTLVISYATEARLFIRDLNQSPFNVGRHIGLQNFTLEQTEDLNQRYGNPITRRSDLMALHFLIDGQPFLTRRAMEQLAGGMSFSTLIETADREDGPFGDHLKRLLIIVSQVPEVLTAVRSSLDSLPLADSDAMHRLVAAGILKEMADDRAVIACDLYTQYLSRYLM